MGAARPSRLRLRRQWLQVPCAHEALPPDHVRVPDERARLRADEGDARDARLQRSAGTLGGRADPVQHLLDPGGGRQSLPTTHLGEARKLKRERPEVLVGVGGCWAQSVKEEVFERFPFVDVAFGPGQVHKLAEFLNSDSLTGAGLLRVRGLHRPPAGQAHPPVPGLGADQRRLQLRLLLLHRALDARAGGLPSRRPLELLAEVRGDGRRRRARGHAAGPERQLLRPRPGGATGKERASFAGLLAACSTASTGSTGSATRARTRRTCART